MMLRGFGALFAIAVFTLAAIGCASAADAEKPAAQTEAAEAPAPKPWQPTYKVYTKWPFDAKEAKRRQEETAKSLRIPVEKTIMLPYNTPMKFILIPACEFVMGSPKTELERKDDETQHRVRITLPFYIGKHEFLQREWIVAKMQKGRFANVRSHHRGPKRPVEQASWMDAQKALWLLNQKGLGTFTLPTEAEWEFACRAGTTAPFHFGETISVEQADYNGYSVYGKGKKGKWRMETTDAGQFPPNAFGLHDMHGNVWEWCWDFYDKDYYTRKESPKTNPAGPKKSPEGVVIDPKAGPRHVLRGGGWGLSTAAQLRSAARESFGAKWRDRNGGFRVVLRTLQFPKPKPEPKK